MDSEVSVVTKEAMEEFLETLQPYVDAGEVIYVNFQQAATIWKEEYNEVKNQLSLESFSMYEDVLGQARKYCNTKKSDFPFDLADVFNPGIMIKD
ncbi:MAG: hypothetical protein ABIA04_02990 [Pseudomonadota bacterium]